MTVIWPVVATAAIMGTVIWRIRFWSGQGDGVLALAVWALGLLSSGACWIGWGLSS